MSEHDDDDGSEQRKHARVPLRLIVEYEDADDFVGDYTENLSAGGTFIHTTRLLERDTAVQLVLSFPGLLQPIALEGIVRWSRGGKQPGVGLEFVPNQDYAKLETLVRLVEARDPRAVARVVRVLLAEDNPHIAELICNGVGASAKRTFGDALAFYFATAENGAVAVELLKTAPFDVAIIDLYLPVLDGAKVIENARSDLGLTKLPIIAISAAGDMAKRSALDAGANVYLSKPMRLREVLESMRRLVPMSA
ncbi:MAG TPA: TIGR02266 family protein [Kofleriaceae bacterium]|nr:TIGR02266 family protein [Kofleriaceae bacterium]